MLTVGCAGFSVPATRYFKEFSFVEIQETHHAAPGMSTLRRWKREAPKGFVFAMLAPREIGQENFREGKVIEQALETLREAGNELNSTTVVFTCPVEFACNRANKAAVQALVSNARGAFGRVIWEAPAAWDPEEAQALADAAGVIAARDPLLHGISTAATAYYRLGGPAGRKSRYEDHAIEKLAELASGAKHDEATYVFANIDMFADAKRFKKAMKLA